MKLISLCGSGLLLFAALAAAQSQAGPSLADLIKSPEHFEGQTISFERVLLSGDFTNGGLRYRLTLKTPAGKVIDSESHPEGITFITTFVYGDKIKDQLTPGQFTPVRLTCTVKATTGAKARDKWLAVVSKIEPITGTTPGEKVAKGAKGKGKKNGKSGNVADEKVVAEGVGKTHDDALKDAFRNAVRQVVGAMVDAETLVKNDELISDKVLTYSAGIVKKYDEISKKQEKGLIRVKINATVEKTQLVARLKAANVTVRDVDGKGLFAEVVSGLEAEKNAEALILKALEGYPANVIRAEVSGEPKVKARNDTVVTLEYDLQVSVDQKKYNAFLKRLIPVLEKTATAKGVFKLEGRKGDVNGAGYINNAVFSSFVIDAKFQNVLRFFDSGGSRPTQRIEAGRNVALCVNTWRSGTDDRSDWSWYYVPVPGSKIERHINVDIHFLDDQGNVVTRGDCRFPSLSSPGFAINENYSPNGTPIEAKMSPYFLGYNGSYCRILTLSRTVTIRLDELKHFKRTACLVTLTK